MSNDSTTHESHEEQVVEDRHERWYCQQGMPIRLVISAISLFLFLYPLVYGYVGTPPPLVFRSVYLVALFLLTVALLPPRLFEEKNPLKQILNVVLLAGVGVGVWVAFVWMDFTLTFTLTLWQRAACVGLILAAMEMTRRTSVKPLNYVAIAALLYAMLGDYLPGLFGHSSIGIDRLLWGQVFTTDGLFGTPLAIGAKFIGLFVFFAAFLDKSGGSQRFMEFTMAIAGRFRGGPAKVAIVGSALMGMISGSSVTNIVTTGVITIPMMKRVGYRPEIAAAVESSASLGSQITPPILGATAFLMSEITGVSLITIMGYTLIPCFLFYFCIMMQVHLSSVRLGIEPLSKEEMPKLWPATKGVLPFLIPVVVLVYLLWIQYSADYAITMAIVTFFVVGLIPKNLRPLVIKNFLPAIRQGARTCIPLVGSLAIAGLIIGVLTVTNLGDRLSYLIQIVGGHNLTGIIVLTAVVCMFLGMGMVTVGAYVLVAVTTVPVLVDLGVPLIIGHLFIFYFAVMSAISPPVMVGVFAASAIADSGPIKTAIHALRFSIVGFIVPFVFIYDPRILFFDGFHFVNVLLLAGTFVGVAALSVAFERYSFSGTISIPTALAYLAAGVMLFWPVLWVKLAGLVLFAALIAMGLAIRSRHTTAVA